MFMKVNPLNNIMTPEAIEERKRLLKLKRELAEKVWEDMCNEGDNSEKEYWIKGFMIGLTYEE